MPSPGAVADAIEYSIRGHARVTAELAQQSLAATAAELQKANGVIAELNGGIIEAQALGWLWRAHAQGLEDLLLEIQARHPNDPLFRRVGGVYANGKPKMVLHQKLEASFDLYMKAIHGARARALQILPKFRGNRRL